MSLAVVVADTANGGAASRADKKVPKTGGDDAAGFGKLVKDDAGQEPLTRANRQSTEESSEGGDRGDGADGIWGRFVSLFERAVAPEKTAHADEPGADPEEAAGDSGEDAAIEIDTHRAFPPASQSANRASGVVGLARATERVADHATPGIGNSDGKVQTKGTDQARQTQTGAGGATSMVAPDGDAQTDAVVDVQSRSGMARAIGDEAGREGPSRPTLEASAIGREAKRDAETQSDSGNGKDRGSGQNGGQSTSGARIAGVSVLAQQSAPAPAAFAQMVPAISETGSALASSLAEEILPGARAEAASLGGMSRPTASSPITTLRIQLQPAELGMVTARISGTEGQLSIEITVDNAEARQRLSTDSDSLVTALRGVGIEVDRVTVQQSQAGTGTNSNGSGRGDFTQSGESRGERNDQSGRQGSERNHGGSRQDAQGSKASAAAGSGVYI
ncbi:MAG: flagellar hook-length control protein FliK [Rhizobiaceae bacterium]|nr:flagellar hook-length control protein FliK [Rhizobiaceae bacterium]